MFADLNSSEFLKALTTHKPNSTNLVDIVNSVFKASSSNIINREVSVSKKIKVKHNAVREAVLSFRDLTLYFDKDGIAETEEYNRSIIEIEQMYRPNCFTIIEEEKVIEDNITVDQFLEQARKELEETELENMLKELDNPDLEEDETITQEQTPKKRGRKGKGI